MLFIVLKKGATYALVAVSMNLLNGFTGIFSLGQAGFMLLGAYTFAIFTIPEESREIVYQYYNGGLIRFALPVIPALVLSGLVAALFAFLVGLPVLKLKSDYLAIATLGFAEIIRAIFQWDKLGAITNGSNMLHQFPSFSSFNIRNAHGEVVVYLSTLVPFVIAGVCIALIVLLINSTYGRALKAIRDDETAAEAMGVNLFHHKQTGVLHFLFLCGHWRGDAGHVCLHGAGQVLYQRYDVRNPADCGVGRRWLHHRQLPERFPVCRLLGVVAALPGQYLHHRILPGAAAAQWLPPGGVLGDHHGGGAVLPQGYHGRARASRSSARTQGEGGRKMSENVLKINHLTMQFGGVVAVNDLSMEINRGEIVALIGPNGAGKTTAFNCVTGVYEPTNGEILFEGKPIARNHPTGRMRKLYAGTMGDAYRGRIIRNTPDQITRRGIARTFQNIRLFGSMTVFENVLLARHLRRSSNVLTAMLRINRREEKRMREDAMQLLRVVGLEDVRDERATSLPYGKQRLLEIARALATEPSLLLLDEPAAGMNPQETEELGAFIQRIKQQFNLTILIIEHHMNLIMDISDRIYVVDFGRLIAQGTPDEIQNNDAVIAAYLGGDEA